MAIEDAAREGWLTVSSAARELNLSAARVRSLCDTGILKMQRTVLGRLIDPKSVADLVKERAK